VTVVADPRIERGGCRVESDLGSMDVGIDAQIEEVARALLGEDRSEALSKVA
jgi:flagellar biosynthesis/type III secretory pathway protein FliH